MSNNIIKLFEWTNKLKIDGKAIPFFSVNEQLVLKKINQRFKNEQGGKNDVISFNDDGMDKSISTFNYVGVVRIGKKTIQIMPKMAKQSVEPEYSRQAIRNLLYMLGYTKKLQIKESEISDLTKNNDDFFEIMIYLFTKNLLLLIKNNYHHDYISVDDNLGYIKGKLLFNDNLKHNLLNKGQFYVRFDEFSENTLLNQILKFTVNILLKISNNLNNLKLLRELAFIFADVESVHISTNDLKRITLNRLQIAYKPILNLAEIFITGSSVELSVGKIETFSFLFDMNSLFEEFIGEFISCINSDYSISLQKPIKYFVENKIVQKQSLGKVFRLIPDIQLFRVDKNFPELIIDTKYKILNAGEKKEGVKESDLYQMNAYSQKYQCKNVILLYPKLSDQDIVNSQFVINDNCNIHVRTVDLCRDLRVEKNALKEDLLEIININKIL